MAFRIVRNDAGNCINFFGSSNPTYWNACLEGEINANNSNNVNVVNKIRTIEEETTVYEFFDIPFSRFTDKDNNAFESASECAQYITDNANVLSNTGTFIFSQNDLLDAQREDTNTTVLFSNGDIYAVNSLHATAANDGTISISTIRGNKDVYTKLRYYNTSVNNGAITGFKTLNAAVDRLNEVLSGGTITSDLGSSSSEESTESAGATFTVYGSRITETGTGTRLGYTSTAEAGNFDTSNGFYSNQTINEPGEYYEFSQDGGDWSNSTGLTFGLFDETTYDVADLDEDVAGNAVKAVIRLRLKNNPFTFKDPDSTFGRLNEGGFSSLVNTVEQWRVGIDMDRRPYISAYINNVWTVVCRTETAPPVGTEYRFVAIMPLANELHGIRNMTVNTLVSAPSLTWYFIESPDGDFYYPLFSSAEEANYVDEEYGTAADDAGSSHQHLFVDESPSQNIWYMPDTYMFHAQASAPAALTGVVWNEIATGADANYAPTQYSDNTVTVNEGENINLQIKPAGDADTYNLSGIPSGLVFNGANLIGTAPEVTGNNVTNPSDTFTITVTKANDYGSSVGTLTLVITNTTAPATALSGFTWQNTSAPLVSEFVMDEGSVVYLDDTIQDGKRFVIDEAWVETNVLPNLTTTGDIIIMGARAASPSWGAIDFSNGVPNDFAIGMYWQKLGTGGVKSVLFNGTTNVLDINSATDAVYDYGFEVDGTSVSVIACATSDINTEPGLASGGSFERVITDSSYSETIPLEIAIATVSAEAGLSTSGISEIDIPAAQSNLTDWTKAVDFSGSSEYLKSNNNSRSVLPLKMNDQAVLVPEHTTDSTKTSDNVNSRPWATAVVFNIDNVLQNQHIWNQGQPATQGHNNIYLRVNASKQLIFGWGREISGYNECTIHPTPSTPNGYLGHNAWYGVYIAHKGTRLNGTDATAANLADAFDIRLMNSASNNWTMSSNLSVAAAWTSTGYRMDRSITGDFTVGGRGTDRSFNGEVASMVVTTLRTDDDMPTSTEIEMMIKDPTRWVANYKVGGLFRHCTTDYSDYDWDTNGSNYFTTQVYLMGDGINDGFSNGIRNQINNTDGYTKLTFNNMSSNDIQNVSITGLS